MEVKPGIYKHFKGGHVLVLFIAKHSNRDEIEVVYMGLNNKKFYARPLQSFLEIVKDENDNDTPRFYFIENESYLLDAQTKKLYDIFCKN